jgi:hypothetical protein
LGVAIGVAACKRVSLPDRMLAGEESKLFNFDVINIKPETLHYKAGSKKMGKEIQVLN